MRQFKPGQLQTGSLYPITASHALTASFLSGSVSFDTGSLVTTASFNAFTASYTTGSFTGSFRGDGSQLTGIVSSKWTGSNPISRQSDVEITGSLRVQGSITGSLFGTASWANNAVTASYVQTAQTASYVLQAVSASYATTASYVLPLTQNVIITGSLNISGSTTQIGTNNLLGQTNLSGSIYVSGSMNALADLTLAGTLRLDPAQDPGNTNETASFLFTSASNTEQGYDLYYRQDGNLVKFKWLEGGISSGLLYGGKITSSGSMIYVSSGSGIILDPNASFSKEINPLFTYVSWPNYSASATYLTSSQNTYIYVDSVGTIHQQTSFFDQTQYEQAIPLGRVTHPNYVSITGIGSNVQTTYDSDSQQSAFIRAFGPIKVSGFSIQAHAGTLSFGVGSGIAYTLGGFYSQDPNSPSHYEGAATPTASIARAYRSGSGVRLDNNGGAFYTTIDPDYWDDGTGVLNTMASGDWQIQRVFFNPVSGRSTVYYGQNTYTTLINALQYLATDSFTEGEFTANSLIFVGYLVLKGQTNNIGDTTNNRVINAGIFRNIAGGSSGGGAVAQNLNDLSDVTITVPSNGQALIYNSGTWENGTPSFATSASFASTASYIITAQTASYVLNAVSASFATSASRAVSSSFASTSSAALLDIVGAGDTQSYALALVLSSSFSPPAFTSPRNPSPLAVRNELVFNGNTGVLQTTASVALTSSIATTASYALQSNTILPLGGNKQSGFITYVNSTGSFQYVKGHHRFNIDIGNAGETTINLTGSLIATDVTASLQGTASFATSASWAPAPVPGGVDGNIQFNNNGTFDGDGSLYYDYVINAFGNGRNLGLNGQWSHAEGVDTTANGDYSHAEGGYTTANGVASHAEGNTTSTIGDYSHAEGRGTTTYGDYSHTEGDSTNAVGYASHAEGESSKTGENAYSCSINIGVVEIDAAAGDLTSTYPDGTTIWFGDVSSVGGQTNRGIVTGSSFNGTNTVFQILNDTTTTIASAGILDASGNLSNQLGGYSAHAEGQSVTYGDYSHAEGSSTTYGDFSHAEGQSTTYGDFSHAEGSSNSYGEGSHAEGQGTTLAAYSHAEGRGATSGYLAYTTLNIASGVITFPSYYGDLSVTFAPSTVIYVDDGNQLAVLTHEVASVTVNGNGETEVTLVDTTYDPQTSFNVSIQGNPQPAFADSYIGDLSHAEGRNTITLAAMSHAEGYRTITHGYYQSVVGQYNQPVESPSTFVIGDGADGSNLHNLLVAGNGVVTISGSLTVSGSSTFRNIGLAEFTGSVVAQAVTGSFTGSFVGDGSGLTGVGATEYIRRSDYTGSLDPNVNYLYTGYAPVGSAESATVWTLSRLAISASGDTVTQITASAAWTNRYSYTYL